MRDSTRILVKLSGEVLAGSAGRGLDGKAIHAIAGEIADVARNQANVALVVGAGNLVRGAGPNRFDLNIEQQHLDTMGMLGTAINCTALKDALVSQGVEAVHQTALVGIPFTEPAAADRARAHLDAGRVVLFSGGTGLPFFSTDTAAVVRALQIEAAAVYKGTQVDGVYDGDPKAGTPVPFLPHVPFSVALAKQLKFMDLSAIALAAQHRLEIVVYNAHRPGNLKSAIVGEPTCSRVGPE